MFIWFYFSHHHQVLFIFEPRLQQSCIPPGQHAHWVLFIGQPSLQKLASYMVFGRVLMLLLLNLMGYKVKRWARFRCLGLYKASSIVVIVRRRLRASFFFTLWDEAWKPICHRHKTVTMNHVKMALANTNVRQDAPEQHLQQQSSQTQYSF